jgi:hypothetical protein
MSASAIVAVMNLTGANQGADLATTVSNVDVIPGTAATTAIRPDIGRHATRPQAPCQEAWAGSVTQLMRDLAVTRTLMMTVTATHAIAPRSEAAIEGGTVDLMTTTALAAVLTTTMMATTTMTNFAALVADVLTMMMRMKTWVVHAVATPTIIMNVTTKMIVVVGAVIMTLTITAMMTTTMTTTTWTTIGFDVVTHILAAIQLTAIARAVSATQLTTEDAQANETEIKKAEMTMARNVGHPERAEY